MHTRVHAHLLAKTSALKRNFLLWLSRMSAEVEPVRGLTGAVVAAELATLPCCTAAAAAASCVTPRTDGLAHRARCAPWRRPAAAPSRSPRSPPAGRTGPGWTRPGAAASPRNPANPRPPPARGVSPWQQSPEPTPRTTPSSWQLPECASTEWEEGRVESRARVCVCVCVGGGRWSGLNVNL